jgi:hypothetical protein
MNPDTADVFVIIRWPADAGLPRYSFATPPHVKELQMPVECVETCSSLQAAASRVDRLNAEDGHAAA